MVDSNQLILISGLLLIIPAYIQIRNYYIVKSNSYLIFSMLFFISMIDQTLVSLESDEIIPDLLISLSFVMIHMILIQLSSELVNHRLPVSPNYWKIHGILTLVGLVILKSLIFNDIISEDYSSLKFLIGEPLRIVAGYSMILAISRSQLIIKTKRTEFIKKGWIFTGALIVISGVTQLFIYGTDLLYELFISSSNSPIPIGIAEILSLMIVITLILFVTIIAIFYPESMLLSHAQLIKAAKLYDILYDSEIEEDQLLSKILFRPEAPEVLIDYIKSLPEDVIEKLEKSKLSEEAKLDN